MSLDPALKNRMVHTITYATPSSVTAYGDRTYGSTATASAYIELVDELLEKAAGETVNVTHKIWTDTALDMDTIIWLPGVSTTKANGRRPERVKKYYDLQGNANHYEIWLGSV